MIKEITQKHREGIKWIGIAFVIKLTLFLFFAYNFYKNKSELNLNYIFNSSGDTSGYYDPCENFVQSGDYNSYCRMPGLLPVYAVLRLLFSVLNTKFIIIIFQFLTGVLSVYALAKISEYVSDSKKIFYLTLFTYSLSSFVSIWDHVGYADSFGTSFLIFSIYFLFQFKQKSKLIFLILSSVFIIWSVFFRPIHGLIIPVIFVFYLFNFRNLYNSTIHIIIFSIPVVICLGLWTIKNYRATHKFIVLQGPMSECFPGISEQLLAVRKLIVIWGDDVQPWAKNSAGEWFFSKKQNPENTVQNYNQFCTNEYNMDSLQKLKLNFRLSLNDSLPNNERQVHKKYVIKKSSQYVKSYKSQYPVKAYFINKIILLKRMLVPSRLDDLPLPNFSKMNLFQKMIKGGYFILLIIINLLGFFGAIFYLFRKNPVGLIPLSILCVIIFIYGIPEQRYLVPIYPFFLILSLHFVISLFDKCLLLKKKDIIA